MAGASAPYTDAASHPAEAPLAKKEANSPKPKARPRFWVSMLILVGILVLVGLGQWDMVVAVVIGLFVGNVVSWLVGGD